jgi:arylsulfatase A-like enzyme
MDNRIGRRDLLVRGAGVAALAALGQAGSAAAQEAGVRPNILCFVSEDCAAPHLGPWGGLAETPTIDRLAAEGVRYENCFSAAPVCAPSRFALITGLPPESCGPAHHMRAIGNPPASMAGRGWPALLRAAGYYCTNNAKEDYNAAIDVAATWDESSGTAHWRNRPAGAPFFAIFNPMTTHESMLFNAPDPAGGPTTPEEVRVPAFSPDTVTTRTDLAKYANRIHEMDAQMAQRLEELEEDGAADDTIVLYYSDHGGVLLRSKRFVYDDGVHVPLIARFGRNVAHLSPAPAGSVLTTPVNSGLDLPPTILTLAGQEAPSWMPGVAFAGPKRATRTFATSMRNRMDERYDMVRTLRDERYRYIRNYMPHRPWAQHEAYMWQQHGYQEWEELHLDGKLDAIRERFWKEKPAEELYDLRRDPDEVRNLAADPRQRATLGRLSSALDAEMLASNDNGFIPEGSALEGWDASRAGGYPLKRVMALAARAIQRDAGNRPALRHALADDNEIIRVWAAHGLLMLGAESAPAHDALRERLRQDPSPHVRVVAAEVLARFDDDHDAVGFLAKTADTDPNVRVRLVALNALTYVPVKLVQPHRAVVQRSAASTDEYVRDAGRYLDFVLSGSYRPSSPVYVA